MTEPYFEYRHTVGFEETNLVGNVYYVNYLRWQGRCRELFLRRHCPGLLVDLQAGLKLFTLRVECELTAELTAFDELAVRMRLVELTQTQIEFAFDYLKLAAGGELMVARGRQRVACMSGPNGRTTPASVPEPLARALHPYQAGKGSRPGRRLRGQEVASVDVDPSAVVATAAEEPALTADPRQLRNAFAGFATGVTVVTVGGDSPHGMTANAFASVSLDPPLVLVCIDHDARMHQALQGTDAFAISVLAAHQEGIARHFASRHRPRGLAQFASVNWSPGGRTGAPLIDGALAWFECTVWGVYNGGDHSIYLGRLMSVDRRDHDDPLVFFDGRFRQFRTLGQEVLR